MNKEKIDRKYYLFEITDLFGFVRYGGYLNLKVAVSVIYRAKRDHGIHLYVWRMEEDFRGFYNR